MNSLYPNLYLFNQDVASNVNNLVNYYPLIDSNTYDLIGLKDINNCVNTAFSTSQSSVSQSTLIFTLGQCSLPPAIYFPYTSFTFSFKITFITFSNQFSDNVFAFENLNPTLEALSFGRVSDGNGGQVFQTGTFSGYYEALDFKIMPNIAYRVAFVVTDISAKIYVNGQTQTPTLVASYPRITTLTSVNYIGFTAGATPSLFSFILDEVRLYNVALTSTQIATDNSLTSFLTLIS